MATELRLNPGAQPSLKVVPTTRRDGAGDGGNGDGKGGGGGRDGGGNGGGNINPMEARLSVVEKAIVRIDAILPTLATKEDIKTATEGTQRWMIATVLGLFIGFGGMFFGMANFLKPSGAPAAQAPAPTVIVNVPPQAAAPPAPAASR